VDDVATLVDDVATLVAFPRESRGRK